MTRRIVTAVPLLLLLCIFLPLCIFLSGCSGNETTTPGEWGNLSQGEVNPAFLKFLENREANAFADYKAEAEARVGMTYVGMQMGNVTVVSSASISSGRNGHAVFGVTATVSDVTAGMIKANKAADNATNSTADNAADNATNNTTDNAADSATNNTTDNATNSAGYSREYYMINGRVFGFEDGNWTEQAMPSFFPDAFNSQIELAVSSVDPAALVLVGEEEVKGVRAYVLRGPWNPEKEIEFALRMAGGNATNSSYSYQPVEGSVTLWISMDRHMLVKHERQAGVLINGNTRIDVFETMTYYDHNITNEIEFPEALVTATGPD